MDAGQLREELTRKARKLMVTECCCYGELFDKLEPEIRVLGRLANRPTGSVMGCLIDDLQDLAEDEEYLGISS